MNILQNYSNLVLKITSVMIVIQTKSTIVALTMAYFYVKTVQIFINPTITPNLVKSNRCTAMFGKN